MITALFIGLWAYLFCMPLSDPGQVFGSLKGWLNKICPEWLFKILIGCPKCHAGQVASWWQVWAVTHGVAFDIPFILIAIFTAYALQRIDELIEALKHK